MKLYARRPEDREVPLGGATRRLRVRQLTRVSAAAARIEIAESGVDNSPVVASAYPTNINAL